MTVTDWIALLGAVLAGIGGLITAWAALIRARNEGDAACEERVRALREENARVADQLHELRMRKAVGE